METEKEKKTSDKDNGGEEKKPEGIPILIRSVEIKINYSNGKFINLGSANLYGQAAGRSPVIMGPMTAQTVILMLNKEEVAELRGEIAEVEKGLVYLEEMDEKPIPGMYIPLGPAAMPGGMGGPGGPPRPPR